MPNWIVWNRTVWLFNCVNKWCLIELFVIHNNTENYLTLLTNNIYLIYMYKPDLALNNLQWLICHKIKPHQSVIYLQWIIYFNREVSSWSDWLFNLNWNHLKTSVSLRHTTWVAFQRLDQIMGPATVSGSIC